MDFSLYNLYDNWIFIVSCIGAVIVILIILSVFLKNTKGSSSVLILQEFNFNEKEEVFLEIIGRASGFLNWIKSLFDKAPTTVFTCNKRLLKYNNYYIPMIKISCVSSVMINQFRIILFILGILFIIAEIALSQISITQLSIRITLIIVGIIFILCSFIKKRTMYFEIYLYENKPFITIALKKGIINSIDEETFEAAANTITRTVLDRSNKVVVTNTI
jgi:hypothetical protein